MPENQRYRVTEKLDAGGMAEVYRGVAESAIGGLKRAIAIKKILPQLSKNKKFVAMFLDEARVSMHLQHANIVSVTDIGMADTSYFIVMEYVDGANLKTILESLRRQNKRLPLAHTIYVMMEVCKGLNYAHDVTDPDTGRELGIVHRDISPPNILVSKRGEVKLVDFGLAKASSQLESTDPGVVKGKFSYLSPEAASGKEVDRRADIFAVGILMYELLTGKRLFYGETDYQTVELVRQAKVPPLAPQNPEVTAELEAIVRKALARDLSSRYQTAADLQDALAQYQITARLKVTNRDIEHLVRDCLQEKQRAQPKRTQAVGSLIDELINEEIVKFTSIDGPDTVGAQVSTTATMDSSGGFPLDPGSFIDTRGWVDDLSADRGGQRNGASKRKDATGEVGLEDLLEGDGAPSALRAPSGRAANEAQAAMAAAGAARSSSTGSQSGIAPSGGGAAAMELSGGASSKKAGPARLIAVVVVLLVLAGGAAAFLLMHKH